MIQYDFRFFFLHQYLIYILVSDIYLPLPVITMAEPELELSLDPEEEATFLALYSTVKFDPMGMCCPVVACSTFYMFRKHRDLMRHFADFHLPNCVRYSCNTCERVFKSKKNKRLHKFCRGGRATFVLFHVPNVKFIDHKGVKVPLPVDKSYDLPTITEAAIWHHKREQERLKRLEYSHFCRSQASPAELMFNYERECLRQ